MSLERKGFAISNETSPAGKSGRERLTNTHPHTDNKQPQSSTCHSSSSLMLISPLLIYFSLLIIIPHLYWLATANNL